MPMRIPKEFKSAVADQRTCLPIISFDRVEAVL